jgi:hypothetical protein
LRKLGTTESTTLALKREVGGKIRVGSLLWETAKVILRGEVAGNPQCGRLTPYRPEGQIARRIGPPMALWAGHRRNDKVIEA